VTESELPPEQAADDVTVGAWLDIDPPSTAEPPALVPEPVQTPSLWDRIKRALGPKS